MKILCFNFEYENEIRRCFLFFFIINIKIKNYILLKDELIFLNLILNFLNF